jgi:DNA-binding CsgD family transcriptional regulator
MLHISARTVEFHKYGIMEKLGAHSVADLVRYASKHGIVT